MFSVLSTGRDLLVLYSVISAVCRWYLFLHPGEGKKSRAKFLVKRNNAITMHISNPDLHDAKFDMSTAQPPLLHSISNMR